MAERILGNSAGKLLIIFGTKIEHILMRLTLKDFVGLIVIKDVKCQMDKQAIQAFLMFKRAKNNTALTEYARDTTRPF